MSVTKASTASINQNSGKKSRVSDISVRNRNTSSWTRPSDWLPITIPDASEQKFVGLVAVFNQDSNYIALRCAVSSGTYTVDWGDGSAPVAVTSNTTAQYNYSWSSLSADTLTSRGYRQAIVTVTPTTEGATFSNVSLNFRHSTRPSTSTINSWIDVAVSAPNATTLRLGGRSLSEIQSCQISMLEQATIIAHNTTGMQSMFRDCYSLQSVPLFDTTNVTNMQQMFRNCISLQSVPLFNTTNVTNMLNMFYDCISLQSVPLFNTASVTTMSGMFLDCISLQSVPLFNTTNVTNMSSMFQSCSSLQSVPLFNTASVTTMSSMFSTCSSLQSVPLFDTASVTTMSNMFSSCISLQSVPLFNTASVTTMSSMFQSCSSLQSVPLFNTASVTTMSSMFSTCSSLQSVPLFNTASVTTMSSMFQSCSSLQSAPLFNTASVTSMQQMFFSCSSLQSVPLFDTTNVTNMLQMFFSCSSLQSVPLFNTASVTNMQQMFQSCSSLQSVPLFDTTNVTNMSSMISSCITLNNIDELNLISISSTGSNINSFSNSFNLSRAKLSNAKYSLTFTATRMGATELNEMYTALGVLNPSITYATGSGTAVSYTLSTSISSFIKGRTVTITGVDPAAYNLTNVVINTVDTVNSIIRIANAATGTYVSGGVAAIQDNRTITVTSAAGVATDDPTIATDKGWSVTG